MAGAGPGCLPFQIFSAKARNMVATSARLALRWGLRSRSVPEVLLMIPSATAQDRGCRAQVLDSSRSP